ncbi:metal ABC transporter substrate-binding protein [Clostridium sp. MSJ-11]|uniref:Metal ABC transporter substrate-binding protein n=1 Tax=Clostridium mobile TaxID=2841512 RepID=A0ABS6EJB2_9CLOT|nr:metal ABC transporter substrate-binding protein [Clostridium mobile]MBU5485303.1 metal ABC transporter substrate-binding protein [Clostridium mobile]
MLIFILLLSGCEKINEDIEINLKVSKGSDVVLNIMTTDKLLYFMTKDIVGDKHFVDFMFKNREEELNYVFSQDAINNISKYDLFIYNGGGLEPWASDFVNKLSKGKLGIINLSRGINILSYSDNVKYKKYIFKENPYYWMNIDNYKIALLNIKNSIQDKDPKNREFYEKNFDNMVKELEEYEKKIKELSANLKEAEVYYSEEDLEYFLKYCNIKGIKIPKGKGLTEEIKDDNTNKNRLFFYYNESELKKAEENIKKYNMVPIKILIHKEDARYIDIVKYNVNSLNKAVLSNGGNQ